MEFKRSFRTIALLMMGAVSLTACSDDDDDEPNNAPKEKFNAVLVVNSGSMGQNDASISVIDLDSNKVYNNSFFKANDKRLGDTGQDAVRYGNKIYIAVSGSNTVEVIDGKTFKTVKSITPAEGYPGSPRDILAYGGKIYVSLYDGYVAKIDTASLAFEDTVAVGPNPEEMTIANDYLYVANSDGLNYNNSYENGKSVSKIDLKTFKETSKIEVLVNPCKLASDKSGNVFVISMGNYYDIPATIQKIDKKDKVTKIGEATLMACYENTLYTINAPFGATTIDFISYNTTDGKVAKENYLNATAEELPNNPCGISVNPNDGNIFIGSYVSSADYTSDGNVFEYKADGTFKAKYNVGVGPIGFAY
ncbi:MAG: hypothetical protein J5554_03350 [Paludibacteraceae bacterium]|nr:hypothetical protein [Paludibacteraceae bacterium]